MSSAIPILTYLSLSYKQIIKKLRINKLNRNANSYYVNSNLVDLERPNLLTSSLSNSNDILASKTPQLQGVTLTPTIYIPNSSEDTPTLIVNETPIISKSANLSCIPNSTKSPNLNRHENEQTNTETENLRAELITLKSFVVDQIYMVKKRSNDKDDELLIKNLLDQIEFLKQELKSKDAIIKMILENYRQNTDYKPQTIKKTAKQNNHSDKEEREFLTPRKTVKMRPLNNIPQFVSLNRFDALRMTTDDNDKESDGQLIQNETDSNPLKPTISKTRAPTTVILGDSIIKNVYGNAITKSIKHKKHVVVKHFSGAKIEDMKHYVKPTQEKKLAQIIIHIGTNDLPGNKNPDEIANEIVGFANSIKTSENNVVVSSIVSRKDRFNNKAKELNKNLKDKCEEHDLQLTRFTSIITLTRSVIPTQKDYI